MAPDEIERLIVEAFMAPKRRARLDRGFGAGKRRAKLLDRLNHRIDDFDVRCMSRVPASQHNAAAIGTLLGAKGAPAECYVVSGGRLDGATMGLGDALEAVVGYGIGTAISCVHGRLAYYEAEEMGARFLLQRRGCRAHSEGGQRGIRE